MKSVRIRKPTRCVVLVAIIFIVITIKVTLFSENSYKEPIEEPSHLRVAHSQQPCKRPQLALNDPQMAEFYHTVQPLECDKVEDWICVREKPGFTSTVGLCEPTERWQRPDTKVQLQCTYRFMERVDEDTNKEVHRVTVDATHDVEAPTDFFHVNCHHKDEPDSSVFSNLMATIAKNGNALNRSFNIGSGLGLNVLIMGFDSLSRLTFMRKLPATYDYLVNHLGGVVLEGYNIVGDGTPQALIPILTGQTEPELPETRRRKFFSANYVNVYPFIWNDFRERGYVTGYAEDSTEYGAFTYRLKGFNRQPTDHYMRPFYVEVDKIRDNHQILCIGGRPRHKVFLDWMEHFYDVYAKKPKFFFGFHGELSHDDINLIGVADQDIVTTLKSLQNKGHLDNTLLIVMSDHGHRFASVRKTQQGKQEERLPFFSLVLPKWFKKQWPSAWNNLLKNSQQLTSPFDIYSTLRDIIDFQKSEVTKDGSQRSISLFKEIPLHRTCADAGIEAHWCACLNWGMVSISDPLVQSGAKSLLRYINNLTASIRHLCHELQLETVLWAERYVPTTALLQFKKNFDFDGFEAEFSDRTAIKEELYQIRISSSPGGALYEATIGYQINEDQFRIGSESISRINKYENSFSCLKGENTETDLRKYCYCKSSDT